MPARRCSDCGINYPTHLIRCPIHTDQQTEFYSGLQPDEMWEWKAEALKARIAANAAGGRTIPVIIEVAITEEDGRRWLSSHDVIRSGISHRLQADDVIELNPQTVPPDQPCDALWEVQAYSDRKRAYWIRPLRVPDFPPDGNGG